MEVRTEWVKCPICGNKTRNKVRQDTILKKYPLFCPKCKQETLVEIENFLVKVIREPDAKTQSQLS
ncbi:MAG: cysteine-rich KTR domain-containing protein [Lachnospiraceae bacterium]|nr:cysteine-rich KTR domain-containing protein [Lachnospiraceae bacterium]